MSDPVSAAKSAREALARALGAIQSDPNVPQQLMAVAEPISSAMGALFQVERSGGAAASTSGPVAIDAVRRALSLLQQQPSNLPAVQIALEAVAGSLGLVHSLTAPAPAPAPRTTSLRATSAAGLRAARTASLRAARTKRASVRRDLRRARAPGSRAARLPTTGRAGRRAPTGVGRAHRG